jgi:hypothetical protein
MAVPRSWQDFVSPSRPGNLPVTFYGQAAAPKPKPAAKKKPAAKAMAKKVKNP